MSRIINDRLQISGHFCGPPNSANGGYVAGRLASYFNFNAEVTLRAPPPLDQEMIVEGDEQGVHLMQDGVLVAEAIPAQFELEVPAPPTLDLATAAQKNYAGFHQHPFPNCFVCGPRRDSGDGLRIFAGRLEGNGQMASGWLPDNSLLAANGFIDPVYVCAALDCPGFFATAHNGPALLGRMSVSITGRLKANEPALVTAWLLSSEGRKRLTGTAVHSADGELVGKALGTWITI